MNLGCPLGSEAGLKPVDQARDLVPVLGPAGLDQVGQGLGLDREQRLGSGRGPADEGVVDEGVDRHAGRLRQVLERRQGIDLKRQLGLTGELAVLGWDGHGGDHRWATATALS